MKHPVVHPVKEEPKYITPTGIVYRGWKRQLWGVVRYTKNIRTGEERHLIGQAWDDNYKSGMVDCVPAPLLFASHRQAAAWCRGMHNKYALGGVQLMKEWKFRAVKVIDTTEVIGA